MKQLDDIAATNQADAAPGAILEAEHLYKYFPVRQTTLLGTQPVVHAVEDASLALYAGKATALVGESGSGKTTIARLLARIYPPTQGSLRFHGEPVNLSQTGGRALRAYRRHVQLVFQDPFASLNPLHTVRYHLSGPLSAYGYTHSKQEETEQINKLLRRVRLYPPEQFIEKYPHQLSGGQRQRIAIARTLAVRPEVLLADEPVSMLDVSIRLEILNLLTRLRNESALAMLFITHDIASARYAADETLVMYAGQIVEGGPSDAVILQARHPYTQLLISAAPDPERASTPEQIMLPQREGEIPSLISPPGGCRFHPRCPHAMRICTQHFPRRTDLGGGQWTHCFLYGDGNERPLSAFSPQEQAQVTTKHTSVAQNISNFAS